MRDAMLIVHFLGLAMGMGTSFGMMFLGIAASKMKKEEAIDFSIKTFALSKMGHIGILLLVISGGYLGTPYWSTLGQQPLFIAKLVLVLVLAAMIGIISGRAKKITPENAESVLKSIRPMGQIALLSGIAIIILAVLNFH